jgi:hypothetical protein
MEIRLRSAANDGTRESDLELIELSDIDVDGRDGWEPRALCAVARKALDADALRAVLDERQQTCETCGCRWAGAEGGPVTRRYTAQELRETVASYRPGSRMLNMLHQAASDAERVECLADAILPERHKHPEAWPVEQLAHLATAHRQDSELIDSLDSEGDYGGELRARLEEQAREIERLNALTVQAAHEQGTNWLDSEAARLAREALFTVEAKDARLAVLEEALRELLRMAQAIWNELPLDKQARLYPDRVTFDPAIRALAGQEPT